MGVPRFFRWLSERYPRINQRLDDNTQFLPVFDNMYLVRIYNHNSHMMMRKLTHTQDANGIIHTCSHPNDETVSNRLSMEEMALGMLAYINKMVHTIRPRKIIFIAVDGCAPRAKMNQQRSRRFAAAKDAELQRQTAVQEGHISEKDSKDLFDSNCITPGTKFMADLSKHFVFFLRKQVKEDAIWQNLTVIYSGHDVPGEGEHKIMEYIRLTRATPGYDPQTRHCLCGLDADLIMLGLATHEPHFALLREMVDFTSFQNKQNPNDTKKMKQQVEQDKWELLHLSSLRQYLQLEFSQAFDDSQQQHSTPPPNFAFDLERIIDDWVLMVTLVGNDFLPHLPTMDIFEGALDTLSELYKRLLPIMGGYMVENGQLQWERIVMLMRELGKLEDTIFTKREEDAEKEAKRAERGGKHHGKTRAAYLAAKNPIDVESTDEEMEKDDDLAINAVRLARLSAIDSTSRAYNVSIYKEKYYQSKFGVSPLTDVDAYVNVVSDVVQRYVEGITWVFQYYYSGVPSWNWFYPFHYAPLASDVGSDPSLGRNVKFQRGEPFPPFTQLLACLPAKSSQCLPAGPYRELMTAIDSELKDFYPTEWDVDENGKRNPWEFVNLLPFIDEVKLKNAVVRLCQDDKLDKADLARNKFGEPVAIQRDLTNTERLMSTLPAALPDIPQAHTRLTVFRYANPNARHVTHLLPGYHPSHGDSILAHHPLFQSAELDLIKVNTFGTESRKETFCLRLRHPDFCMTAASFVHAMGTNRTVWSNFPYLHECEVVKVVDADYEIGLGPGGWSSRLLTKDEQTKMKLQIMGCRNASIKGTKEVGTGGIMDNSTVLVCVRPLNGMIEDVMTGEVKKRFDTRQPPLWISAGMVLFENPLPDPRFMDKPPLDIQERFPRDTPVLCVGAKGYGQLGVVASAKGRLVKCIMPVTAFKRVEIGHNAVEAIRDEYHSLKAVAQLVNVPPMVADKLLSSVLILITPPPSSSASSRKSKPQFMDIGLNLRVGKDQILPHYCRSRSTESIPWSDSQTVVRIAGFSPAGGGGGEDEHGGGRSHGNPDMFEYSNEAIDIFVKYREKFPQVFEALCKYPHESSYRREMLFAPLKPAQVEVLLDQVTQWLRQIPTYKLGLAPVSSKFMSKGAVAGTMAAASELARLEEVKLGTGKKVAEVELPVDNLIKSASTNATQWLMLSPTAESPPKLGDRVVNFGSEVIPFGHVGTVVAIHPKTTMVNVLFDKPFVGGVALWGGPPGHGFVLKWNCLLSLSRPRPVDSMLSSAPMPSNIMVVAAPPPPPVKPVGGVLGSLLVDVTPAVPPKVPIIMPSPSPVLVVPPSYRPPVTPVVVTPLVVMDDGGGDDDDDDLDDLANYWQQQMMKTDKQKGGGKVAEVKQASVVVDRTAVAGTNGNTRTKKSAVQASPSDIKVTKILQPPAKLQGTPPAVAAPVPLPAASAPAPRLFTISSPPSSQVVAPTATPTPKEGNGEGKSNKKLNRMDDLLARAHKTENRTFDTTR